MDAHDHAGENVCARCARRSLGHGHRPRGILRSESGTCQFEAEPKLPCGKTAGFSITLKSGRRLPACAGHVRWLRETFSLPFMEGA